MSTSIPPSHDADQPVILSAQLPGPSRKRSETAYEYRLRYANPNPRAAGCYMVWEVLGGRLVYQIAVEREAGGRLRCHCSCADAVFRAEAEGRFCKHVRGFLAWGQSAPTQEGPASVRRGA